MILRCLLLILVGLYSTEAASLQRAAAPARRQRTAPPYSEDPRFQGDLPVRSGVLSVEEFEKALGGLSGASVAIPGFVSGLALPLPEGRRRLRDALDALADIAQGEWRKVGAAYVLVVPPDLLEYADLDPRSRDQRSRELLKTLIASIVPPQFDLLRQGRPISLANATVVQRQYIQALGMLGYYGMPTRRDPSSIRGEGVSLALAETLEGRRFELGLQTRAGTSHVWLTEPVVLPLAPSR